MGTSVERSSDYSDYLAEHAEDDGIAWDTANAEDLYGFRAKTQGAIRRAHEDCRPTVLEVRTYRYYGHSVADANAKKYRPTEEIERHKNFHDPIRLWCKRLLDEAIITGKLIDQIDEEAKY